MTAATGRGRSAVTGPSLPVSILGSLRPELRRRNLAISGLPSGPAALDAAAEVFSVGTSQISTAISYYGDYADEASARAGAAWRVQQQLIA